MIVESPIHEITNSPIVWIELGGSNSVVESQPSKLLVAGSIPVSRSTTSCECGHVVMWSRGHFVVVPSKMTT